MSNNYLRNSSREKTVRITISLDGQIEEKIRTLQHLVSKHTGEEWSVSKIINLMLLGSILAPNCFTINEWAIIGKFAEGKQVKIQEINIEDYAANIAALKQVI